ncbi:MAG: alpha/beta fold hydrolase [Myxococcaceae bacterium]|jgi:polyhydroxyalkanoate synthase|nr:alpha/beta fold hydrolase [Myxococcaceae bacterium]
MPDLPNTLMPTPRSTVLEDGPAKLYRFHPATDVALVDAAPVLLVPSMINRWYVLDLRKGASVAEALVNSGLDTWCLDWGAPEAHDRYFTWADALARLDRMMRRVIRETGKPKVTVLGYCMGATLSSVHAAMHPERYAGFINLLGPIDFTKAGMLGHMTDPRWFDAEAIAEAGNVAPHQMQAGFKLLRPTQDLSKMVTLMEKAFDPVFKESYEALEAWANDNVAFPAAAYTTYIEELYQKNHLVQGKHFVGGKRVDLKNIVCPLMTIAADKDTICPPDAAKAINGAVGSSDTKVLAVPGGHVGAVVGSKAADKLYPALVSWMKERNA